MHQSTELPGKNHYFTFNNADVIYDQSSKASFSKKNESVQYNAELTIMGVIKGSSLEKLYQELGVEYLYQRIWARLHLPYKVFSVGQPSYIYELLPSIRTSRQHIYSFNRVSCRSEHFKNSFIPNVINEWNKLDVDFRSSTSHNLFPNTILNLLELLKERPSILIIQWEKSY